MDVGDFGESDDFYMFLLKPTNDFGEEGNLCVNGDFEKLSSNYQVFLDCFNTQARYVGGFTESVVYTKLQ